MIKDKNDIPKTITSVFDEFKQQEIDKVNQYFLKGRMLDKELLAESVDEDDEVEKDTEDREI